MDNNSNFGVLLNAKNIKLNRYYFDQMAKLIGVKLIYRAPKAGKDYTTYGEIDTMFEQPVAVWGVYEEHPTQQTMRKLGLRQVVTTPLRSSMRSLTLLKQFTLTLRSSSVTLPTLR